MVYGGAIGFPIDSYAGTTEAAGSDDATEEGSVSVVPVIGATIEEPGTCKYGGVGCSVNSLKVAPRLLETEVSSASSEEV